MVERTYGLDERTLAALARLEASSVTHDGGRLKLEWGALRSRSGELAEDLLWWDGELLVGFAGIYAFGSPDVEVTGMVDPVHRRRGIGAALLDAALEQCRERSCRQFLLVAPRASAGAKRLAVSRGGVLEHSEHALVLDGPAREGPEDPTITLRPASASDVPEVGRILEAAFGHRWEPLDVESSSEPTLVAERDGSVLATMRVHKGEDSWGIYGFGVEPGHQGRGIGRDLLRRICRQARDAGIGRVHLEVSVDNDRALNLYTSLGFTHEQTEDYYDIAL